MTRYQEEARAGFAALLGKPVEQWRIAASINIGDWYDFFDPTTGKYGQCSMGEFGTWRQAPLGYRPVILEYIGPERRAYKSKLKGVES